MIHHTLLPEKERNILKREYRIRLAIFLLFFMSCSVLIGILALIPSYILSYSQEKVALNDIEKLQKSRKNSGVDVLLKELSQASKIATKIKNSTKDSSPSKLIALIVSYKNQGITIDSFDIVSSQTATSTMVNIRGKASTRDLLIKFKERLISDGSVLKVDLPVSDLVKNRDIQYNMKISLTTKT